MKRAIVMGASSGLGFEVSRLLLAEGWQVGVAARRAARLEALGQQFPGQVQAMRIDVNDEGAAGQLLLLIEKVGGMDLYLHVSGIGKQNPVLDAGIEQQTVCTNALGFTRLVDAAFHYFAGHGGGHLAVISSIAGTKGLGVAPSYSATKAFQNVYIDALEQQAALRRLPIRFTDIRPGFVDTDLLSGSARYPMLMDRHFVARRIVKAIRRQARVKVIDRRYALLVLGWRLIPRWLWRRLPVKTKG